MLGLNERVSSVDVSLGPDSDKTLLDTLTDDRPTDPCELLQDDDLSQSIDQWLSELTDKQREVVVRRFGLRGHESSTHGRCGPGDRAYPRAGTPDPGRRSQASA